MNSVTSFIDASTVYGHSAALEKTLRNLSASGGLLAVNSKYTDEGRPYLPFVSVRPSACLQDPGSERVECFAAGDSRVNEILPLSVLHTLWVREHNRLAKHLTRLNPHWRSEVIYQETRKIIGALHQVTDTATLWKNYFNDQLETFCIPFQKNTIVQFKESWCSSSSSVKSDFYYLNTFHLKHSYGLRTDSFFLPLLMLMFLVSRDNETQNCGHLKPVIAHQRARLSGRSNLWNRFNINLHRKSKFHCGSSSKKWFSEYCSGRLFLYGQEVFCLNKQLISEENFSCAFKSKNIFFILIYDGTVVYGYRYHDTF